MKRIILLTILGVMIGCSKKPVVGDWLYQTLPGEEKLLSAKEITINVFWEYDYLQMISRSIYAVSGVDKESIIKSINVYKEQRENDYIPGFCNNSGILIGERIFASTVDNRHVDAECLYENSHLILDRLMKMAYNRDFFFETHNDYIRVMYIGDSLSIKSGTIYGHKRKRGKMIVKNVNMNELIEINGDIYEFFISLLFPVSSLTIETPLNNLDGYSPLKFDSSILPQESPGYKKLRKKDVYR